jgi:hypothetical protein
MSAAEERRDAFNGDGQLPTVSRPAEASPSGGASTPRAAPARDTDREFIVLCYTLLSFFIIGFSVWLVFAWVDYGKRYAQSTDGWHRGGTYSIELTLIREDVSNLGCASAVVIDGLECANRADQTPVAHEPDDGVLLRPYSTVDSVLLLGSGLWTSPGLRGPLPAQRFTVVCDFHMAGVMKSVSLRWSPGGPFKPVDRSLPVGTFSGCVIPR